MLLSRFSGVSKEALNRSGLRCNGAAKARVRMLKMSGFCSLGQASLESSKTPPPTHRGTGRITVDAREKGLTACMMHYEGPSLQIPACAPKKWCYTAPLRPDTRPKETVKSRNQGSGVRSDHPQAAFASPAHAVHLPLTCIYVFRIHSNS